MNKSITISLLALMIIASILVGCGGNGARNAGGTSDTASSSNVPVKQAKTYTDADINAMLNEAENNGAAANKHYKGKNVRVIGGHVQNIDSDLRYISVDGTAAPFTLIHVTCNIDNKNKDLQDAVVQLRKGQNVVVYGTITDVGDIMGYTMDLDKIESLEANQSVETSQPALKMEARSSSIPRPLSNAMLGNVKLGDSIAEAEIVLGNPTKKTVKDDNKLRYVYPLMDVAYDYGEVTGMAADDVSVCTPKGIHAGSSLNEVTNQYGSDYMLSTYENLNLYEYKFKDKKGSYLLRFAVTQGNDSVKYISIRYVD